MKLRWLGHSAFELISNNNLNILIDPFIRGNPSCPLKINDLNPENVTVHTLALKRSSNLAGDTSGLSGGMLANEMINLSHEKLKNYIPYYMYRQSKSLGNLENVGWCKKGFECAYNIFMMEECHTILACGAGAVTKLKDPGSNVIERVFNFKYPYEYNDRLSELFERKQRIYEFYSER